MSDKHDSAEHETPDKFGLVELTGTPAPVTWPSDPLVAQVLAQLNRMEGKLTNIERMLRSNVRDEPPGLIASQLTVSQLNRQAAVAENALYLSKGLPSAKVMRNPMCVVDITERGEADGRHIVDSNRRAFCGLKLRPGDANEVRQVIDLTPLHIADPGMCQGCIENISPT
jgi:hypothetical protein